MRNVFAAVLLSVSIPTPLVASECFGIDPRTTRDRAALVFEGTVIKVDEPQTDEIEIVMDVHRVWKGDVSKRATVYYPKEPLFGDPESTPKAPTWLKTGTRFLVFTNVAFEGRPRLAQHRTSWIAPCYGLKRPDPELIRQLGPSRKPKKAG